jgi:hypothetical protein
MKKTLTSFTLIFAILFNVLSFTACTNPKVESPKPEPRPELVVDVDAMLAEKYSDFEIPREKLEYALNEALKKIDEISRIVLALHISLLNRKYKYVEKDFEAIGNCLYDLKEIIKNL